MALRTTVFDIAKGNPAVELRATLAYFQEDGTWLDLNSVATDEEGVIDELSPKDWEFIVGIYRITFDTSRYFAYASLDNGIPVIPFIFEVSRTSLHHHVRLLLAPFGYSVQCES